MSDDADLPAMSASAFLKVDCHLATPMCTRLVPFFRRSDHNITMPRRAGKDGRSDRSSPGPRGGTTPPTGISKMNPAPRPGWAKLEVSYHSPALIHAEIADNSVAP